MLYAFAQEKGESIKIIYLIGGKKIGSFQQEFRLCHQDNLEEMKILYDQVTSIHIYSIHQAPPKEINQLWIPEKNQLCKLQNQDQVHQYFNNRTSAIEGMDIINFKNSQESISLKNYSIIESSETNRQPQQIKKDSSPESKIQKNSKKSVVNFFRSMKSESSSEEIKTQEKKVKTNKEESQTIFRKKKDIEEKEEKEDILSLEEIENQSESEEEIIFSKQKHSKRKQEIEKRVKQKSLKKIKKGTKSKEEFTFPEEKEDFKLEEKENEEPSSNGNHFASKNKPISEDDIIKPKLKRKRKASKSDEEGSSSEGEGNSSKKKKPRRMDVQSNTLESMNALKNIPKSKTKTVTKLVTRTYINEKGYKVTQDVEEQVEVPVDEMEDIPSSSINNKSTKSSNPKKNTKPVQTSSSQRNIMSFFTTSTKH